MSTKMKIVVFGASGGTGRNIVEQALEAGHMVTAFVRTPEKLGVEHNNLTVFQGDVMDAEKVEQAITGQKAVINTLGPTRPPVPGMLETAAKNIVAAMEKHGVKRIISTTGGGVRAPQDQPKLFDHIMKGLLTMMAGSVLRDSEANVNIIRASHLDWTIVRYPRLIDGERTGKYRVGYIGKNSGSQISRADGADFILKELERCEYLHKMPMVSY
jgi:putative NADH-flavin reductase